MLRIYTFPEDDSTDSTRGLTICFAFPDSFLEGISPDLLTAVPSLLWYQICFQNKVFQEVWADSANDKDPLIIIRALFLTKTFSWIINTISNEKCCFLHLQICTGTTASHCYLILCTCFPLSEQLAVFSK